MSDVIYPNERYTADRGDIRTTESSRTARVTAWVEVPRRNTTMVVIPLTVGQYLNGRSLYGKVCDTLLLGEARDEAEGD